MDAQLGHNIPILQDFNWFLCISISYCCVEANFESNKRLEILYPTTIYYIYWQIQHNINIGFPLSSDQYETIN